MTSKQQRSKIAEVLTGPTFGILTEGEKEEWFWESGAVVTGPPDEDLNGALQMEKHPSLDQDLYSKWLWIVVTDTPIPLQDPWDVVRDNSFAHFDLCSAACFRSATATQRAKAFLLTFDPNSFSPPPATPPNTDV